MSVVVFFFSSFGACHLFEKIQFVNCLVVTELDLTQEGMCEFEVNCTKELMRKLINS